MKLSFRTILPLALGIFALSFIAVPEATLSFAGADSAARLPQTAQISGDPEKPRRHFRERDTLILRPVEAAKIYKALTKDLVAGYKSSGDSVAVGYSTWRRYNTAPYRSATHGLRYVNNYANELGSAYGRFEQSGRLPVGAIIAKDSFSVSLEGEHRPGPLFIMEKMEAGFNYVSGDWRYSMIMPDGEIFGVTKGFNSERVKYCIGCHLAKEDQDHLFFMPEGVRVKD